MRAPALAVFACSALLACTGSGDPPRTGPAAVTVGDVFGPVAGAWVVFHRPDGTVQELAVTDGSGRASAVITEGALLTVGRYEPGSTNVWRLVTVAAVEPGDELVLAQPLGSQLAGWGTVSLSGPVEGASSYRVYAACSGANADEGYVGSLSMPVFSPACGTSIDAVALARAPGGGLLAYASALGVPVMGSVPSLTADVALGAWRTDFGTLAFDATNAPAGSSSLYVAVSPRRNGRTFEGAGDAAATAVAPGGSASLLIAHPQAFATLGRLWAVLSYAGDDEQGFILEPETALASRSIDLSAELPPRLSGAAVAEADGVFEASWQQAASDPALDGAILSTRWMAAGDQHDWTVVLPPGRTSFAFPPLPPELAGFEPAVGAGPALIGVTAYDAADAEGYAAFKARRLGLVHGLPDEGARVRGTSAVGPSP